MSALLMEETEVPGETTDKHCHIMLYQVHLAWAGFEDTKMFIRNGRRTDQIQWSKEKKIKRHTMVHKIYNTEKLGLNNVNPPKKGSGFRFLSGDRH